MTAQGSARITRDSVIVRSGDVVHTEMHDGEILMMSVENGEYYGLDEIGSEIWRMLEEPLLVTQICEELIVSFDVGPEECERDVIGLLQEMLTPLGIIGVEGP